MRRAKGKGQRAKEEVSRKQGAVRSEKMRGSED
jgi:hypothetical protein